MTAAPQVVTDFVRRVIRAFYDDAFVVTIDALLRENNYATEEKLSSVLSIPVKDVRTLLPRLKEAKLVRSDRRLQKKRLPSTHPQGGTKTVHSTFWYVDFMAVLDVFQYRLHHVRKMVAKDVASDTECVILRCPLCKKTFTALDIPQLETNDEGRFVCDRRLTNTRLCETPLVDQDVTVQQARARDSANRLEQEMRPILQLLSACASVKIPKHPLEGADMETWGTLVPENVDEEGQALGPDGRPTSQNKFKEHDRDLRDYDILMSNERSKQEVAVTIAVDAETDSKSQAAKPESTPVIEKPDWFKNTNAGAGGSSATAAEAKQEGDAADGDKDAGDGLAYLQDYMKEAAEDEDVEFEADQTEFQEAAEEGDEPKQTIDPSSTMVLVAGERVALADITDAHQAKMTSEENEAYYDILRNAGFLDDDD